MDTRVVFIYSWSIVTNALSITCGEYVHNIEIITYLSSNYRRIKNNRPQEHNDLHYSFQIGPCPWPPENFFTGLQVQDENIYSWAATVLLYEIT